MAAKIRQMPLVSAAAVPPASTLPAGVPALLERGDWPQATAELVRHYGPRIVRYARGVLADMETARDLAQDWAEALLRELPNFRGESSPKTWIYSIARNLVVARLRRYSRRHRVALASGELLALPQPTDPSATLFAERRAETLAMLAGLLPPEREILVLRTERDLSHREVAEILNISEETARKRYQLAKDKLVRIHQSRASADSQQPVVG
jgi:RNA polymerase sigma-70 factor (ECF subfamily)